MKKLVIGFPILFNDAAIKNLAELTLGIIPTPDKIDDLNFSLPTGTAVLAPHEGKLSDDKNAVSIQHGKGDKSFFSQLSQFELDPKLVGAKRVDVKKGDVIGVSRGVLSWSCAIPRPGKKGKAREDGTADVWNINPLILSGMLGGPSYTGITGQDDYTADVSKWYQKLIFNIGTHAIAFGLGWGAGKF